MGKTNALSSILFFFFVFLPFPLLLFNELEQHREGHVRQTPPRQNESSIAKKNLHKLPQKKREKKQKITNKMEGTTTGQFCATCIFTLSFFSSLLGRASQPAQSERIISSFYMVGPRRAGPLRSCSFRKATKILSSQLFCFLQTDASLSAYLGFGRERDDLNTPFLS